MAVIDELEVRICVDGQYPTEYDEDEEHKAHQPSTITRYVEAVSGAPFTIEIAVAKEYDLEAADAISFHVYLDGKPSTGVAFKRRHFGHQFVLAGCYDGLGNTQKFLQYHFADLRTRDLNGDDDIASFKKTYEKLGTIEVVAWRVTDIGHGSCPSSAKESGVSTVPEKALNGRRLDVATSLKEVHNPRPPTRHRLSKKLGTGPVARFIFKYRTRKALQTELIIPRSPSPVPLEGRDINTVTRDELRQIVNQERENKIKHEHGVKRQRTATSSECSRPFKTSRLAGKEIVHLDSDEKKPQPNPQIDSLVEGVIETDLP